MTVSFLQRPTLLVFDFNGAKGLWQWWAYHSNPCHGFNTLSMIRSSSRDVRLGAAWQRGAFEDKLSMSSGSDTCADD